MSWRDVKPYVINKDMGRPHVDYSDELPGKNADGLGVVEPTEEQKYLFDTQGWLLIESVLGEDELEEMREWCLRYHFERDTLVEHDRTPLAGPTQRLADHPVAVGMLNEFTANPAVSSQECYGFSLGGFELWYRTARSRRTEGLREERSFGPHNGNGLMRLPGDVHFYSAFPGKAFCPHVRIVWELNPVQKKKGGTLLVTGSHKSVYTAPDEIMDPDSSVWTTYDCPAGSMLIFAEATTHSAHPWTNTENDRMAIAGLYNQVDGGWNPAMKPDSEVLEGLPPLRRTLFRDRHITNNVGGLAHNRLFGASA
ncbi:phytanoyl-CoA dioxygenase family protein [bacterium]|jgi:hypothetical protein|nr:phytanoyl-CoA dioxygenase family protein [bacterium]HCK09567.1 hypothetical protein [Candidatus Latescibacterota bacterium]